MDSENVTLSWKVQEDGLKTDYEKDNTYYTFFCPKDPASYSSETDAAKEEDTTAEETMKESDTETVEETVEEETAEETEKETEEETEKEEGADTPAAVSVAAAAVGEHGKAADSLYADYWDRDWYGWYVLESCDGEYEDEAGSFRYYIYMRPYGIQPG